MSQVPSGLSACADVPGRGERVAHVVQAVEGGDQVVAGAGEGRGRGDLEAHPVGDAGVAGPLARQLDRLVVVVRAGEPGVRVLLREQDRGRAEPAADVGDGGAGPQLVLHAVERRDPGRDQVGDVAGAEELLAAGEHVGVLLVPAQAAAGPEGLGDPRLGPQRAEREHERAGRVDAAVRVGQREGLLFGHRVAVGGRVVLDVAARGLAAQPFGDVARVGLRARGQLLGGRGPRPPAPCTGRGCAPMTTFPAATVAPRSVTNLPRNSCSLSLSMAMMTLPLVAGSPSRPGCAGALQWHCNRAATTID